MSELELSSRYINERIVDDALVRDARQLTLELGLPLPSAATAAHLTFLAAATGASTIIEIGTGAGVLTHAVWRGAPKSTITCIDAEPEYLGHARRLLISAGARGASLRFITGHPQDVLPRMTEGGYDLVVIGGDIAHIGAHLQHGLRLIRPGGTIVALGALNGGKVASPARRDALTSGLRALYSEFDLQEDLRLALLPLDGGILQLTKLG
ncbi:O-methyltransferase [Pseudoclavibacter sp. 8L]|uniref:O-methyltransferase n=1 Tax=Pseudoclavibacter sp. 8L TaxID=2653162 RepID=UPI0012F17539|nr:methyltransferase domain-containing protein [Pseudoclavibacter sp. 8L]VXB44444.1 Methyltransferase [Pseudoclavibacter sp. 8L]